MTAEKYRRAGDLFHRLRSLPKPDRDSALDLACEGDAELRSEVVALLEGDEKAAGESFLQRPAIEVAANLLMEPSGVPGIPADTQLGVYRIGRLIGQGGMGAVYEGFDLRLQRKAAIKILPPQFAADPDRVRRFQREARAASQLNHPNIVSIYDADFDGGYSYIAAELVEGQTLRQLLADGPLDLKSVHEIGVQLCSALAAAHDARILHRDIKPENIMLRPDGIVKVLDFGLAKLVEPVSGQTDFRTRPGGVAGTIHYLSPEQVLGKTCGSQSDIFSAGVVLYELAVGSRPFDGPTDAAIFAQIATAPPAGAAELSQRIDPDFAALIMRALEKDPELRFQTAQDLRAALRHLMNRRSPSAQIEAPRARRATPGRQMRSFALAAICGMALASGAWYALRPAPAPLPNHFERMTFGEGEEAYPNLFPDGKQFIYASSARGHWDIYLQRAGGSAGINLTPDSAVDNTEPALSPDGAKIVFRSEREGGGLFVMEATGENLRRVGARGHLPAWSPDGRSIVYCDDTFIMPNARGAPTSRLHVLDLVSNTQRDLQTLDAVQPNWSPHGFRIAYWGMANGNREIYTVAADGSLPVQVTRDPAVDWNPVWGPSGKELYFISDRGGTMGLWRIRIDERSGKTSGQPEPVTTPAEYVRFLSWSADGSRFLYSHSKNQLTLGVIEFDKSRLETTSQPLPAGGGANAFNFGLSPDESQIAYDSVGDSSENVWIVNVNGSGRRRLTFSDSSRNRIPSWSPDGKQILFMSNRTGQYQDWVIRPDGSGLRQLTNAPSAMASGIWLNEGRQVLVSEYGQGLTLLDPGVSSPVSALKILPGFEKIDGAYLFYSRPENGLIVGYISGKGENPLVLYSLAEGKLTRLGVRGIRPSWLPGSTRYLFFLRGDGCFLYDREQKREKRLFSTPHEELYDLKVSANGKRIYFSRAIRDAHLWMGNMAH